MTKLNAVSHEWWDSKEYSEFVASND